MLGIYRRVIGLSLLLGSLPVWAGQFDPPVGISDEGGSISRPVYVLDCVGAGIVCTQSGITGTLTVAGGGGNSFETIAVPAGASVVADSTTDTLTITETSFLTITGTAGTDTIDITQVTTDLGTDGLIAANAVALTTDTTGNYVGTVADGTGIDGTAAAEGATYTPTLDLTEISSLTWGAGAFTTMTFDAGATDPVLTAASDNLNLTTGNFTVGATTALAALAVDGGSDEVQLLAQGNGTQTNDIFVVETSTGTNLVDVDTASTTFSNVTGVGIGDTTPAVLFVVGNGDLFQVDSNGHIKSAATAPTIGTPATCGTSPSASVTSATDVRGLFTITTGSVAPTLCTTTITFGTAYTGAPKAVLLQLATSTTLTLDAYIKSTSTTTFVVEFGGTPTASTAYKFYYLVLE